jgi:hypothetical protein
MAFSLLAVRGVETCRSVFSGYYYDGSCEQTKHVIVDTQSCEYTVIEVRRLTGSL